MRYDFGVGTRTVFARAIAAEVRAMQGAERVSGNVLAAGIGLSQNYVSKRLRDELPFTLDDIEAIAEFFETTVQGILASAERHEERLWAELSLSAPRPNLAAVADEDADLVREAEAQQEGP